MVLLLVFFFSCTAWNSLNGSLKMKNPLRTPIEAPGSHPKPILRVWIINLAAAERNFDEKVFRWPLLLLDLSTVSVLWGKRQRESQRERDEKEQKTLTKKKHERIFEIFSLLSALSLFFTLFRSFSLFSQESFLAQRMPHLTLSLVISPTLRGTLSILLIFLTTKNFARTLSHSHSHYL